MILRFAVVLAAGTAFAASRSPSAFVIDRGLHRQWRIVCDEMHPERPPRLVEVPWSEARAEQPQLKPSPPAPLHRDPPLVRPGMSVTVVGHGGDAEWHLLGTALASGWSGDTVSVRAGLHGAPQRGIVLGPAMVELLPGKAKN
jgi:hypothetical protein